MKGLADYLCEECRRMERAIARDYRKKEEHELQEFIEQTRREIAKTEALIVAMMKCGSDRKRRPKRRHDVSNPLRCFTC